MFRAALIRTRVFNYFVEKDDDHYLLLLLYFDEQQRKGCCLAQLIHLHKQQQHENYCELKLNIIWK